MILLKLRASFGKLHGELDLRDGLNLIYLPNEGGKSTWSAFLLAMLYGIDTSERSSSANDGLPAKERYRPWDGSPMEGSMDILWQGRAITLERTSSRRAPMGNFRAYETASGVPIPALTGENCGRILCGVERSVFERTAFIRQLGLSVGSDPALEKRLSALVTTGQEDARPASQLEEELRKLRNSLRGRAGKIPRLTEEIGQTEALLHRSEELRDQILELTARRDEAAAREEALENLLCRIDRAQKARESAVLTELSSRQAAQAQQCRRLEETVAGLPDEARLHSLQKELDQAESSLQTAQMELAFAPDAPRAPVPPPCFAGLDSAGAGEKVKKDLRVYAALSARKPRAMLLPLLGGAGLLAAGAVLFFLLRQWVFAALGGAGLLLALLGLILRLQSRSRARKAACEAQALLEAYGVDTPEAVAPLLESFRTAACAYEAEAAQYASHRELLTRAVEKARAEAEAAMAQVARFASVELTSAACHQALSAALRAHTELAAERRSLENLRLQLEASGPISPASLPQDPEALTLDPAKITYDCKAAAQRRRSLENQLSQCRGALGALADPVALEACLDQLREELAQARFSLQALELALEALTSADEALRSRFSPQITAETGQILSLLTEGKYSRVLLDPDMKLSVRGREDPVMRPAAAMSCGTGDQMYLALRLAMCRRLLPPEAPLLLDDTLVNFDDARARAALQVLSLEAQSRQILLFTCRPLPEQNTELE